MKKSLKIITVIFLFLGLISINSKGKTFNVKIIQDGKVHIPSKNNTIKLNKKEFSIVFEFSEPMGLLVNGSFKKKTFKLASKGKAKTALPGFYGTGMAEELLNPNNEILISNEAPSYWFYENEKSHRFNTVEKQHGKIICTRIIDNLDQISTKTTIQVAEVKKSLYLVFISYKRGTNTTDEIELQRRFIKIKWK